MAEGRREYRCGTCAAWKAFERDPATGFCRRRSPGLAGEAPHLGVWPATDELEWCLEYVPDAATSQRAWAEIQAVLRPAAGGPQ